VGHVPTMSQARIDGWACPALAEAFEQFSASTANYP
jgi:hypothetical protein